MKKSLVIFSIVLTMALICSTVQADLYVVAAGKKTKNAILVSPGSTETQSGTALLTALSKITDAAESNPYIILLEPGIYDVGSSTVVTKSWVDIQGAGEKATTIKGNYDHTDYCVVKLTNSVELSSLTVEHTGSGSYSRAIINEGENIKLTYVTARTPGGAAFSKAIYNVSGSVAIHFVTAFAKGSQETYAVMNGGYSGSSAVLNATHLSAVARTGSDVTIGVYNFNGTMTLTQGKITATGPGNNILGIKNINGTHSTLIGLNIKAASGTNQTYGVSNDSTDCKIIDCQIEGADASIHTSSLRETTIATTQLLNPVSAGGTNASKGKNVCACVYDANFTFYAAVCP